ncbi:MAG: NAD-dependent epimerase/dehydratase family protein [Gilvibacter sp.]
MILKTRILIIGACGQIGSELTSQLRAHYGNHKVIAADIVEPDPEFLEQGPFEIFDATSYSEIEDAVIRHEITEVYLMAAMLSATAEKFPEKAWNLNMRSLFNVLDLAKDGKIDKVFWPSSIAVFGPTSPKENTPQTTVMEPTTVYGISKQTGERWCEYYHKKFGIDVRSIRYPGLISYTTPPGGGTTDYAIDIYHKAIKHNSYVCFLKEDARLPMMYMNDAIKATIDIMQAPPERIKIRSSYNLSAMSFSPSEVAASIKKYRPDFEISYDPDFRQEIADSWPHSIDDSHAREDWGWQESVDLDQMTQFMLEGLSE